MNRVSLASLAVLAATAGPVAAQNLVRNPGFDLGETNWSGWSYVTGLDGVMLDSTPGFYTSAPNDASFSAAPGDSLAGTLYQDLPTTAGQNYVVSFWLLDEAAGAATDSFTVSFGGLTNTIFGYTMPGTYSSFSFTEPSSGATTRLSFQGFNEDAGWNLDDVSVTDAPSAIPEPSTWALLLVAFASLSALSRRRPIRA